MFTSRFNESRIKEIQFAYQELLEQYMVAVELTANQSFFNELPNPESKTIEADRTSLNILMYILGKILWAIVTFLGWLERILHWKPILRLFVESHIRAKLNETEIIFTQIAYALPPGNKSEKTWFREQMTALRDVKNTLRHWQSVRGAIYLVFPILLSFILDALGVSSLDQAILAFTKNAQNFTPADFEMADNIFRSFIAPIILMGLYLSVFFRNSFTDKRNIFHSIKGRNERNIYEAEIVFFGLLERKKTTEFPVDIFTDVYAWLFVLWIVPGISVWIYTKTTDVPLLGCCWSIYWAVLLFIVYRSWLPYRKRLNENDL